MKEYTVADCFYQIRNGANIKQGDAVGGYPITRIETTANDTFNRDRMGYAGITDLSKYESYILEDGDLLMSHINSVQYLGRTVLYEKQAGETIIHGMNLLSLKANRDIVLPEFARYFFRSEPFKKQLSKITKKSVNQASFTVADLKKVVLSVPSLSKQNEIVQSLDKCRSIAAKRQQQLSALDDLIKARFVEMFGDMLLNPKNLPEQRLDSLADIAAGITKGRKVKTDELYEVPYMAVSNVKDGFIDWTTVKTIMATDGEIDQYRLIPGDVLMTEGGDPDKLGRGAIIHEPPENCIHQNHIFRVRLNQDELLPVYMAQYLQQQKAKKYFLGCAKQTTGIASINMKQLRALPVLVPKIELQNEFAIFVTQIDKSKSAIQRPLIRQSSW